MVALFVDPVCDSVVESSVWLRRGQAQLVRPVGDTCTACETLLAASAMARR